MPAPPHAGKPRPLRIGDPESSFHEGRAPFRSPVFRRCFGGPPTADPPEGRHAFGVSITRSLPTPAGSSQKSAGTAPRRSPEAASVVRGGPSAAWSPFAPGSGRSGGDGLRPASARVGRDAPVRDAVRDRRAFRRPRRSKIVHAAGAAPEQGTIRRGRTRSPDPRESLPDGCAAPTRDGRSARAAPLSFRGSMRQARLKRGRRAARRKRKSPRVASATQAEGDEA